MKPAGGYVCRIVSGSPLTEGRGLKSDLPMIKTGYAMVAPHGGAWIEVRVFYCFSTVNSGRPSRRGVD